MTENRKPDPEDAEREAIEVAFEIAGKAGGSEHDRLVLAFLRGAQWQHRVTAKLLSDTLGGLHA